MIINKLNKMNLEQAYGVLCSSMMNNQNQLEQLHWFVIPKNKASEMHMHFEYEIFIVLSGKGLLITDKNQTQVKTGEVIFFEPFEKHSFLNSDDEDLVLLSLISKNGFKEEAKRNQKNSLYIITATPPTPNGTLHLGHMSGPYLRADIMSRYLKINNNTTYFISGRDDHQSYTAYKASSEKLSPEEIAQKYSQLICESFTLADISIDYFSMPQRFEYKAIIKKLFLKLYKKNKLIPKETETLFCNHCDQYLYEVYVEGICPHCQFETNGTLCERCGNINDCIDLIKPVCKICKSKPDRRVEKKLYFPISHYKDALFNYYESNQVEDEIIQFSKKVLKDEKIYFPVTHYSQWGFSCPVKGFSNQIISVWFEMGLGHLASIHNIFSQNDFNDSNEWQLQHYQLVQFFGFDNSFFNCILFPAIYIALEMNIPLPKSLHVNQFYQLENDKFSTSRNHAIWCNEIFKDYNSDVIRFYLSLTSPEQNQTRFKWSEFYNFLKNGLFYQLNEWVSTVFLVFDSQFHSLVPDIGLWTDEQVHIYRFLIKFNTDMKAYYSFKTFRVKKIAENLEQLVTYALQFFQTEKMIFKTNENYDQQRTHIALHILMVQIFSYWVYPIMPQLGLRIWQGINNNQTKPNSLTYFDWVKSGTMINTKKILPFIRTLFYSQKVLEKNNQKYEHI